MDTLLVYILGSFLIALLVALFQYRPWQKTHHFWLLTLCRTVSFTLLFLLIINPETVTQTEVVTKPRLSILLDNSQSIRELREDKLMDSVADFLKNHPQLNQKFTVHSYKFDSELTINDSLDFTGKQSNIGGSLQTLNTITKDDIAPIILLSDGNQTLGPSYVYENHNEGQPIYPIILGDTVQYVDLKINQINTNTYTFLNNRFPVEIFVNYAGNSTVKTNLDIFSGSKKVYSTPLSFSTSKTSQIISFYLEANSPGIQKYSARLNPLKEELLKINNVKEFGIEVIDQSYKIALISDLSHPDLAAIKAIVSVQKNYNLFRLSPKEFLDQPEDFDFLVLYQPDNSFKKVFEFINQKPINTFILTGAHTDWAFLNSAQSLFIQDDTAQTEAYQAILNPNFEPFSTNPLPFQEFPPLLSAFGSTVINVPHDVLLFKTINGTQTDIPLLLTYKSERARHVLFFAENLWKWRMRVFQLQQSFDSFDAFFGTLFKYLSTQKASDKLKVTHDVIFDGLSSMDMVAQLFNDNFEPNTIAELSVEVRSKSLKSPLKFPMLLKNTSYKADLSSLEPGSYEYTVQTNNKTHSKTGRFEILPFNIESQFLNANVSQLRQLANETGGQAYFDTQGQLLVEDLIRNEAFKSIQKIDKKIVPLIKFKIILIALILFLGIEWFLRKYLGLI